MNHPGASARGLLAIRLETGGFGLLGCLDRRGLYKQQQSVGETRDMLTFGTPVAAEQAHAWGLADAIAEPGAVVGDTHHHGVAMGVCRQFDPGAGMAGSVVRQVAHHPRQRAVFTDDRGGLEHNLDLSDRRAKKDIVKVGKVDDLNLYRYRYKGEDKSTPKHLGVMAQEVEKVKPEAVINGGKFKLVDYGKALLEAA